MAKMTIMDKHPMLKGFVRYMTAGLVSWFFGALTNVVTSRAGGGKVSSSVATAGGLLAGIAIGDEIGKCFCNEIDEISEIADEMKQAIEESKR